MAAKEQDVERTAVKTYVPAYQRDEWDAHAEELGMSRSEFVRSMVQAGRKGFDPRGQTAETEQDPDTPQTRETDASGGLEDRVRSALEDGPRSWDDLFADVTGDIESDLESTLQSLQADNAVQYSGPKGGYVLVR